jgi:hypothetical protein
LFLRGGFDANLTLKLGALPENEEAVNADASTNIKHDQERCCCQIATNGFLCDKQVTSGIEIAIEIDGYTYVTMI